jgi:tRNA(fMet)-specific endonuclease VapC
VAVADCLIDTNVISYMLRGDTRAEEYRRYLTGREAAASFMTVAGLRRWAIARNLGTKRLEELRTFLDTLTIVYANDALCTAWATIVAEQERIGRPIDTADAWVAAPAWLLGIPLGTHNKRHFATIAGLQVISFA